MNSFLTAKIKFYQIFCMIGILFIHNYNYSSETITPGTVIYAQFTMGNFIELLLSHSLTKFRIALLMTISGYLMAHSKPVPYFVLLQKKFKSLLIPYILISFIALLTTALFEIAIYGFNSNTGLLGKSLWSMNFYDYYRFIFVAPISFQLWYLKSIFLLAVFTPVIRFVLSKAPLQTLSIALVIWFFTNYLNCDQREDRCVIFYFIGFYLRMYNKDILNPIPLFKPMYAMIIFITFSIIRTWLAFNHEVNFIDIKYLLTLMFKANEMMGVYAFWFCFDKYLGNVFQQKWYAFFNNSSFFIYAFHAPLINFIGHYLLIHHVYSVEYGRIASYFIIPIILFPALVLMNKFVTARFPKFYSLISGGRVTAEKSSSTEVPIKRSLLSTYMLDFNNSITLKLQNLEDAIISTAKKWYSKNEGLRMMFQKIK